MSAGSNPIRKLLEKEKLNGSNFLEWFRNLRIVLRGEKKAYVLDETLPEKPASNGKAKVAKPAKILTEDVCDYCSAKGHWKRNCKIFLEDMKKGSVDSTSSIHVIEVNVTTCYSTSWV